MRSNHARVGRGLYLLKIDLDSFVPREFLNHHAEQSIPTLQQILGQVRDTQKPFANMKTQDLLAVMQAAWAEVFRSALAGIEPGLVREVNAAHETWASRQSFSDDAAYRALDLVQGLLAAMASPSITELERLKRECLEPSGDADPMESLEPLAAGGLRKLFAPSPVVDSVASADAGSGEAAAPLAAVDPYLAELVRAWREFGALEERDQVAPATREGVEPVYAGNSRLQELAPSLTPALESLGIDRLYEHQAAAIEKSLAGANVVLAAPPAGGNTLSLAIALAATLPENPGGYALALYPAPEVADGQLAQLNNILAKTGLTAARYDRATEPEARKRIEQNPPPVLVTTPEMLNRSLLGRSRDWADFLRSLRLVAIDETRQYSGYFGANVAVLLRRLAHQLARIGANPRYFLAGAGANPAEHAGNLTGQAFEPVSSAGGPAPRRHYLFVDPGLAGSPSGNTATAAAGLPGRIGRAAAACVSLDKTVLVCGPTRKFAEQCYASAQKACEERGLNPDCLRLGHGGPAGDFRAEIQAGIRDGAIKAVFSAAVSETGELEIEGAETGRDAGGLDGVILAGFPDTLQATWQRIRQAGGGREREAFALGYALNDPVARFYAHNLPAFLDRKGEEIVVAPGNREIIRAHLPSLLREAGGRIYSFSAGILGDAIFRELPGSREAEPSPEFPQEELNLRGLPGQTWTLRRENEPVGFLSAAQKFHEAYEGAVYFQSGIRYRVGRREETGDCNTDTNGDAQPVIHLLELESPEQENRLTVPCFEKTLEIREEYRCSGWAGGVAAFLGNVALSENLRSVKVIDESLPPDPVEPEETPGSPGKDRAGAGRVIDTYTPSGSVFRETTGHACWLDVAGIIKGTGDGAAKDAGVPAGVPDEGNDAGLAALEQMLRVGALFAFPADSRDITTHRAGGKIFLIERYPGGIGLAQSAFDRWRELLEIALEIAQGCPCPTGCAHCLVPPRSCHDTRDTGLDKVGGIELARRLLQATGGSPPESASESTGAGLPG